MSEPEKPGNINQKDEPERKKRKERKQHTFCHLYQDLDICIAHLVVLVTDKIAYLLLADMMFRQGDVLAPDEPTTCSLIDIPRHIGGR